MSASILSAAARDEPTTYGHDSPNEVKFDADMQSTQGRRRMDSVGAAIKRLDEALGSQRGLIQALEERLTPYVVPAGPTAGNGDQRVRAQMSPLATMLMSLAEAADEHNTQLRGLMARLES
jgi:hypothetical protein